VSEIIVILHNIRSTHNVGSIFRTADAVGVTKMYLTGYTPKPIDRFGRVQKDIAKTALGACEYVSWEAGDVSKVMSDLKKEGFSIISIEQDEHSIALQDFKALPKMVLLLGNEVRGISKQLRDKSNYIVEIPMHGKKESLNVSVTAGIVLFSLYK